MSKYVDGFVLPLPKKNVEAYRKLAEDAAQVFLDHGALEVVECVGEDVKPGKVTSFPQSVNMKDDETVVFSWIIWPSRQARDEGNEKAMKDPRFAGMDAKSMPFDSMRMIFGGFDILVEK